MEDYRLSSQNLLEPFDTIYATCGDRVYKRKVKTVGANAFQPPTTPPQPRL